MTTPWDALLVELVRYAAEAELEPAPLLLLLAATAGDSAPPADAGSTTGAEVDDVPEPDHYYPH